jgi:acetyl esterase/lipase
MRPCLCAFSGFIIISILNGVTVRADEPGAKIPQPVVPLWTDKVPGAKGEEDRDKPTLTIHLPDAKQATGTGIIVCPGGGYFVHAVDHEGHQMARWLNSMGIAAFVLKYRLKPRYDPADALVDAKRALRYVRSHAKEYNIAPERVGMLGFSAGAHLSACSAIDPDDGDAKAEDPIERQSCRPDFLVLIYGGATKLADPSKKDAEPKTFGPKAPPAFLISTSEDRSSEGTIDCYRALRKAGAPAELHVFGGYGPHGTGLAPGDPALGVYPRLAHAWMRKSGLLTTAPRLPITGRIVIDGKPLHRGWVTFIPLDPNKPTACCYITERTNGKYELSAKDGPCVGPHRVEVRVVATALLTVPSMNDAILLNQDLRYEVKPGGANQADFDLSARAK